MKVISFELDPTSIDKAINELRAYREDLYKKVELFVDALLTEGITVAKVRVSSTQGDSELPVVDYNIRPKGDTTWAEVSINGNDVLFVEFGAGIAYNTTQEHPQAAEFGYGIGTYPSEHPPNRAINPGRWIYGHDDDGKPLWSIGTEATMPIYGAAEAMRNVVIETAKNIFGG